MCVLSMTIGMALLLILFRKYEKGVGSSVRRSTESPSVPTCRPNSQFCTKSKILTILFIITCSTLKKR